MKTTLLIPPLAAGLLALTACQAPNPPQPGIRVSNTARAVTMNIDARDYASVSDGLVQSWLMHEGLEKGSVIALGPIKSNMDGPYVFDAVRFQEKLQVRVLKTGRFKFSYAVNGMSSGQDEVAERFKIMQLQYEKEAAIDPEDLRTFGTLANIDYLLFGRISSLTTGRSEVTYTYNWKLGNCANGLIEWADEVEITKAR